MARNMLYNDQDSCFKFEHHEIAMAVLLNEDFDEVDFLFGDGLLRLLESSSMKKDCIKKMISLLSSEQGPDWAEIFQDAIDIIEDSMDDNDPELGELITIFLSFFQA